MLSILRIMSLNDKSTSGFINRQRELDALDEIHGRKTAQLAVVFGRRRIGKTSLLNHWLKDRVLKRKQSGCYWVAHRSTSEILLREFSAVLASCMKLNAQLSFASWTEAFHQMFVLAEKQTLTLILDEFTYLVESVPEVSTLLQKMWDARKAKSKLRLILCGSQYQLMNAQFFTPRQPLFGRATATMMVEEIPPAHLQKFLPRYSPAQVVETFSIIGGVPKYLELWDDTRSVLENVRRLLLSPATIFRHEAVFLIHDEIAEPRTYLALLQALGGGLRTPVQMAKTTGLPITHVGKYLHQLIALKFVRRVQSAEAPNPKQTRLSKYEICDPFLRFHFEFMHPYHELMETQRTERHMEIIQSNLDAHVGRNGYEELARRYVQQLSDHKQLSFMPTQLGRAWTPHAEVDIYAANAKEQVALFGECRWTTRKMDVDVLEALMKKVQTFTRLKKWKKHYILFSRNGFTGALSRLAKSQGIQLIEGALVDQAVPKLKSKI
jgi:uncharacterized protein